MIQTVSGFNRQDSDFLHLMGTQESKQSLQTKSSLGKILQTSSLKEFGASLKPVHSEAVIPEESSYGGGSTLTKRLIKTGKTKGKTRSRQPKVKPKSGLERRTTARFGGTGDSTQDPIGAIG